MNPTELDPRVTMTRSTVAGLPDDDRYDVRFALSDGENPEYREDTIAKVTVPAVTLEAEDGSSIDIPTVTGWTACFDCESGCWDNEARPIPGEALYATAEQAANSLI